MKGCPICGGRFQEGSSTCPYDGTELRDLPDPLLGRTLAGRYQIQERVGYGGMGSVYRAVDETRAREVAIKFLAHGLSRDPEYRKRFSREVRVASRIDHEHIVDTTDFGQLENGQLYLVMEYLNGETLCETLEVGSLPVRRVLVISHQIAQALARAHELDVVHRDIKPENVHLVSGYEGDFVKLLDFGLAQMRGEARLTATGTVFGTPEYLSPEQAAGREVTGAADLYSLGCVMFEMLTGDLPFDGTAAELVMHHLQTAPPRVADRMARVPDEVDAIVFRLMAKEASHRASSAYALAEELGELLARQGTSSAPIRVQEAAAATVVGAPFAIEDAWAERIRFFSGAFQRGESQRPTEPWLSEALQELSDSVEEMRRLRVRMNMLSEQVGQRERSIREARLRFGRAIDELGRDAIRIEKEVALINSREDEARGKQRDAEDLLRRRLHDFGALPATIAFSDPILQEVAEVGQLAREMLETRNAMNHDQLRQGLERERSDVGFQLEQLKGRLGSLNAEADAEIEQLRTEIDALDGRIAKFVESLSTKAGPLYAYLRQQPGFEEALSGMRGSLPTMLGGSWPVNAGGSRSR